MTSCSINREGEQVSFITKEHIVNAFKIFWKSLGQCGLGSEGDMFLCLINCFE